MLKVPKMRFIEHKLLVPDKDEPKQTAFFYKLQDTVLNVQRYQQMTGTDSLPRL